MTENTDTLGDAVRNTCILATIHFRALGLNRTDKQASSDVTMQAGAASGAARVVVSRLPGADEHHKAITKAQRDARAVLWRLSMPYGNDDGWRLLPNVNWSRLLPELSACKNEFDKALNAFLADLPQVRARALANKGTLNVEIPTDDELRSAYGMETEFRPINDGQFKGLPPAVTQKLEAHAKVKLEAAAQAAVHDTLERFVQPLDHFIERMVKYDEREAALSRGEDIGRHGAFRNSVVDNVKELVEVVSSFNVTGDERLAQLEQRLAPLMVAPDTLRDSQPVRYEAEMAARQVLADLKEWIG